MNVRRSVLYPLRLVGARLGRRSAPVVLVVLGIAAGASVVLGGRAGTLASPARPGTAATRGPASYSSALAWGHDATPTRASSPVASSSGWRSAPPSPAALSS